MITRDTMSVMAPTIMKMIPNENHACAPSGPVQARIVLRQPPKEPAMPANVNQI